MQMNALKARIDTEFGDNYLMHQWSSRGFRVGATKLGANKSLKTRKWPESTGVRENDGQFSIDRCQCDQSKSNGVKRRQGTGGPMWFFRINVLLVKGILW